MTPSEPKILVVAASAMDGEVVRDQLVDEFHDIDVCADPTQHRRAFEDLKPQVLVVAMKRVADSERRYAAMAGGVAALAPCKTIILCGKEDVERAHELCCAGAFDDYVLFWPMVHDAKRLSMSIRLALRLLVSDRALADLPALNAQARGVLGIDGVLERERSEAGRDLEETRRAVERAGSQIRSALDEFGEEMIGTGLDDAVVVREQARIRERLDRLDREAVRPSLRRAIDATHSVDERLAALPKALAPQIKAAAALGAHVSETRPLLLVVDDDDFIRKVLDRLLGSAGYDVEAVGSGADLILFLRRSKPDLILMDVQLPDVDGIVLTEQLKGIAAYASIPVIMLTGQSQVNVIVESRRAGAADFVVKPFDRTTLLRKVSAQLGLPAPTGPRC